MPGFGWNFYGFFAAAASWVICYFLWAWWAGRRRRPRAEDAPAASLVEGR